MRLTLTIGPDSLAAELAREIAAGDHTVVDVIERLIGRHLEGSVSEMLGNRLIKAPRVVVHPDYYKNRFENLDALSREGYSTWYPEVRFSTSKSDNLAIAELETVGFGHGYVKYGGSIDQSYKYTKKVLKTQVNHTVRLNTMTIPPGVFGQSISAVQLMGIIKQPYIANLTVGFGHHIGDRVQGFRVVSFDHVVTGERRFCLCHQDAHIAMLSAARGMAPSFAPDSWPHRVIALLEHVIYSDGLCHFCVAEKYGASVLSYWYGDQIRKHFEPYVDLLLRSTDMDLPTATAEAKSRLSISRWVREDDLCQLVAKLFPNTTIRREASPPWLGQQRLDIYIPDLALAIEHQGEQHYRPIGGFGGEEGFAKARERDERKRSLCLANGVTMVEVRFDDPLTLPSLRSRLRRWLT